MRGGCAGAARLEPSPLGEGGRRPDEGQVSCGCPLWSLPPWGKVAAGRMRGGCPAAARLRDSAKHFALIRQRAGPLTASPEGEAQRVEKPPSAGEVPRRGGGREPCHSPKYFGQPYSSLPHRLRAEPPRRGGQGVSTPFSTVCGFPLGGSCQRPRPLTDEGQPCHYYPFTACRGKPAPHPALRGHLPPKGKAFGGQSSFAQP